MPQSAQIRHILDGLVADAAASAMGSRPCALARSRCSKTKPLVVVRASFLRLCDGDHCAAALLNNFVYWRDWCVIHGRYDVTASAADPDHRPADPERWFWKTAEGLVNDDLLRLWGEKKVRAGSTCWKPKATPSHASTPRIATTAPSNTGWCRSD